MLPYTRRDFAKLALAVLPAAGALSTLSRLGAAESAPARGKPNSKVRGVSIGLNVPYSFGNNAMSADETLANLIQLGVSAVELRTQPVEAALGAPANLVNAKAAVAQGGAAANNADELRKWRLGLSMDRVREFRKKWEDAGVAIEIVKVDNIARLPDDVLDYAFTLGKNLGARGLSTEIFHGDDDLKRVGAFADKHQFPIGYHGHATTTPEHWEHAFALAKYNYANVDLGHFVAGNNKSPVEFLKKHHARVTHIHVKDRKLGDASVKGAPNPANLPFGEGETPIAEVLRLIRDNKWPIQATIEFEYRVPAGSDRMTEIAKCVKFCRDALA